MKLKSRRNELMGNDKIDIAHLIRSVQRLENNPDCFGVAEIRTHCDRMDCAWRELCMDEHRDPRNEEA